MDKKRVELTLNKRLSKLVRQTGRLLNLGIQQNAKDGFGFIQTNIKIMRAVQRAIKSLPVNKVETNNQVC